MKKILFLLSILSSQFGVAQISKEGKDFLLDLTWNVPFGNTRLSSYNKLNENKNILYGITPGTKGWPLTAEFKSNPHIKLNEIQEKSSVALNLSLLFNSKNAIYERRLIVTAEKDFENFYRIRSLIESFSFKTEHLENGFEQTYKFYATSKSKKPFATATKSSTQIMIIIYDSEIKL